MAFTGSTHLPSMTTSVQLIWNGPTVRKSILIRVQSGVKRAIDIYYRELKRKINEWSSAPYTSFKTGVISPILRVGGVYPSKAGQPPKKATGNLYKSIKKDIFVNAIDDSAEAHVWTDVLYAPTLEFGGDLQVNQATKKHTQVRLVNPVKKSKPIAPRPVWLLVWKENLDKMIKTIVRG